MFAVKNYFVTGTDTGVGKTVVSTILATGVQAHYWKPIQTGAREGRDSEFVGQWIGSDRIHPETFLFSEPISPHLAAELEGQEIDLDRCLQKYQSLPTPTVIEGAGGVLVPLNSHDLMIDLIQVLAASTILVASTRLGTINHTLLSLEALRHRHLPVIGVITTGMENPAVQRSIEKYGLAPVLGHIPHCSSFSRSWFSEMFQRLFIPQIKTERLL